MPPTFRSWKTLPAKIKFRKPWKIFSVVRPLHPMGVLLTNRISVCGSQCWIMWSQWSMKIRVRYTRPVGCMNVFALNWNLLWVCVMSTRLCGTKSQKTSCSCRDAGGGYLRPVPALFAHLQLRMANKRMPFFPPPSHQCLNSPVTASVDEKLLLICRLIREGSVTNSLPANAILYQEKILSLCACGCVGGCVCLGGCLCVWVGVNDRKKENDGDCVYLSTTGTCAPVYMSAPFSPSSMVWKAGL